MGKIKRPQTYTTPNRDTNTQADALQSVIKQADNKFTDLDTRLATLEANAFAFPDTYTYLWWPCTDFIDSGATTSVVSRTSTAATLTAAGSAENAGGMSPQGKGYARVFGSSGGYSGGSAVVPGTGAASLSGWVRVGDPATKNLIGYFDAAAAVKFTITTDASGRLLGNAVTAAGTKTVGGINDLKLSPNVWYFMWLRFTGTALTLGLDTHFVTLSFAATTLNWGAGTWRLGYAGTNTGEGLYRDVRVHSRAIPQDFIDDSYSRWHRLGDR